ncbi:hypothetical protein PHLGIDRAFT_70510 [Phlebiopsis gigantea 11061_1 CR5-6]|uniref:Aminoglycoside phosphotransferase domain-containing protein n=1 Tax=Phlebiopsis gigantea (strain 11061_1 CR5-6) TaxID=745531 RepID=A0A0C3NRC7_PHLG1|nr:hypothetical protein PHLGIDRAFT_70510 [Phlebiopsis gigantea 11061_1 CR5-6]
MNVLPDCYRTCRELKETFWLQTGPKIPALQDIISAHFGYDCGELTLLDEGAYARAYKASLSTGKKLVVRVVLPVRDGLKTEAEVATMDFVRAETNIPIPRVHLFCSSRNNPIGAEWIVMDFVPGERFIDCWDELSLEARRRTVEDLAGIMSSLYSITSTHCASLISFPSLTNSQRARRFGDHPSLPPTVEGRTSLCPATFGPVNDLCFVERLFPAPFQRCGPFTSEREYLEAVAYANIIETDRRIVKHMRWPHEKVFEVYDRVRAEYAKTVESGLVGETAGLPRFHFSHGDLSDTNILLDKTTGCITGIIDWEAAGFRPAWLAAGKAGMLEDHSHDEEDGDVDGDDENNDDCYCLHRTFFEDPFPVAGSESQEDFLLRSHFLVQLAERDLGLAVHHRYGTELRAIFAALCEVVPASVEAWIEKYRERRWDVIARGKFPFDVENWIRERIALWQRYEIV